MSHVQDPGFYLCHQENNGKVAVLDQMSCGAAVCILNAVLRKGLVCKAVHHPHQFRIMNRGPQTSWMQYLCSIEMEASLACSKLTPGSILDSNGLSKR